MDGIARGFWDCANTLGQLCYAKANIETKKNCPITATVFKVLGAASIIGAPIVYAAYIFSPPDSTNLLDTPPPCDNVREYYKNLDSQKNLTCYSSNKHLNETLFSPEEQADEAKRCTALELWDICYPGIGIIVKKTAETLFLCDEFGHLFSTTSLDTSPLKTYVTADKRQCFIYYQQSIKWIGSKDTCVEPVEFSKTIIREQYFYNGRWSSY